MGRMAFGGLLIALATSIAAVAVAQLPPGGTFTDDDGNAHEGMIEAIVAAGVTNGCAEHSYCPDAPVTRAQMASFLVRAFDLPPSTDSPFIDTAGNVHQANIDALAAAGVTLGCDAGVYCPDDVVRRDQMATFLDRALDLGPGTGDWFVDDDGNAHEHSINAIADAGISAGCGDGHYCPAQPIPRDQMASLIGRALGLDPIDVPPPTTTAPSTTTTAPTTTTTVADDGQGWGCHPAYVECVPNHPVDVDCAGGSGDGPVYVEGPITVKNVNDDPYGLDHDNDGIGCEP